MAHIKAFGIENFTRHFVVAIVSVILIYIVWQLNSTWSTDMRLWKSLGGAAFILLWFTLLVGPLASVCNPFKKILSWRKEASIWFAVLAFAHGILILNGWVRWGFLEFFGYKFVPQVNNYLLFDAGFGLANLIGLIALFFTVLLALTSFGKAVYFLGKENWKWLHSFTYVIFYLIVAHIVYFAFVHYTPTAYRVMSGMSSSYPDNPLAYLYLIAALSVFLAQATSFIKNVIKHRKTSVYK